VWGESHVTPPLHCRSVVGGRFQDGVQKIGPVPGIIRHSLRLEIVSQPPRTSVPSPVHLPQDSAKASALRAEVRSLLDKGAIVHIDNPGPGFYSHIFVVPKKQKGSWSVIIDLSRLNRFLRVPHFKMETTRTMAAAILPVDWAVSLDLRDAYLHVPVHPDYQRYLRFYFEGRVYQFKAMPFSLASTRARVKTSLLPRRLAAPQRLQRHSENTDEIAHHECQIGRMDYERGEVGTDFLPGFHIHRDSFLHPWGTNVPPSG
jgi:hypothetical protein